jgi:voltage-gated potassium channel Kch
MRLPFSHFNKGSIEKIGGMLKDYIQSNRWESIAIFMGILAFVLSVIGFYQMFEENKLTPRVIDSIYNTFRVFLFDMERPDPDTPLPWSLEIARWIAPFVTSFYAGKAILYLFKNQIALLTLDGGHIIICGAGEKGRTLGIEWLERVKDENHTDFGKKVFFIESDPNCSNIETLQEAGAIVIQGKAQEELILDKLKVDEAEYFITTTDHDTTNMEIISTLLSMDSISKRENKLKCYVHLLHNEFYDFFMAKKFSEKNTKIDIKIFNLFSNSARMLFADRVLGDNVFVTPNDIKDTNKTVKLAILGFGKLAENVLIHSLQLGHFYNETPIEVTVVYDQDKDENANLLDEFSKQYDILNPEYNGSYWSVKFIDDGELSGTNMDFTQIVIAYEDEFESLSNLMKILKRYNSQILDNNIDIAIYSNSFENTANIIQHDKKSDGYSIFNQVRTFGELNKTCSYDMVINQILDKKAKANHEQYETLHDAISQGWATNWEDLSMFLKDSNRYLMEHMPIKKNIVSLLTSSREEPLHKYEAIKSEIKEKFFYPHQDINWDKMGVQNTKYATHLSSEEIEMLGKLEHQRWNAFHILNGWKKLDIADENGEKIKKDVIRKLHPCLVSWEELDKVSKNHNHDYKSDDIETFMRIPSLEKII